MKPGEVCEIDALVLAGGRIEGSYARAAGTPVKALAAVGGEPVIWRVVAALSAVPAIRRVCVVGPTEVREVLDGEVLWQLEGATALDNLSRGVARLGGSGDRLLVCASDLPALAPPAVEAFLRHAPLDAEVAMPVIEKAAYLRSFPGDQRPYVRLAEGAFTGGSQLLVRPRALLANLPLLRRLFDRRKSQIGMARAIGPSVAWKLVCGRLTVAELEERLSVLTGCRCRAVLDCHPELACDIDSLHDWRFIEEWRLRGR